MCGYCFVANYFKKLDGLAGTPFDRQNKDTNDTDDIDFEIEEISIEVPEGKVPFELPQVYQENFIVPGDCDIAEHEGLRELFVAKFIESKLCEANDTPEMHNFTTSSMITDCINKSCTMQIDKFLFHLKESKTLSTIFSDFRFLYEEHYYRSKLEKIDLDQQKIIKTLRYYYAWWHKGFGLKKVSAEEVQTERSGIVFDPLETRKKTASDLYLILFRCFFYSLQEVSTFPIGSRPYTYAKNILRKIITTSPFMLPDFGALDLWLLRVAIKTYAQNYGDFSKDMIGRMRPLFVYYLCKHCGLGTDKVNAYYEFFKSFYCDHNLKSIDDIIQLDH